MEQKNVAEKGMGVVSKEEEVREDSERKIFFFFWVFFFFFYDLLLRSIDSDSSTQQIQRIQNVGTGKETNQIKIRKMGEK